MKIGVILAGGLGKRMKSDLPKPCHKINGIPMIQSVINKLKLIVDKIFIVYGKKGDVLQSYVENSEDYIWCHQEPQLGTGHALQVAFEEIKKLNQSTIDIIVCNGDAPFIKSKTLENIIDKSFDGTLLSCYVKNPQGYGRILKNPNFIGIKEEKDCTEEEKKIQEVNAGCYYFSFSSLERVIYKLQNNNAQKEYYITDILELLPNVKVYQIQDEIEIFNINNIEQLQIAEKFKDYL